MTDKPKQPADMHEEVVRFHTERVNLRSENFALHAHVQSLERELSDARVRAETMERAHREVVQQNGWYARAYASLLAPFRIATQTMVNGLNDAMHNAAKASMTDSVDEAEKIITDASKLRPAPDNPPQEYLPPKHQEQEG